MGLDKHLKIQIKLFKSSYPLVKRLHGEQWSVPGSQIRFLEGKSLKAQNILAPSVSPRPDFTFTLSSVDIFNYDVQQVCYKILILFCTLLQINLMNVVVILKFTVTNTINPVNPLIPPIHENFSLFPTFMSFCCPLPGCKCIGLCNDGTYYSNNRAL